MVLFCSDMSKCLQLETIKKQKCGKSVGVNDSRFKMYSKSQTCEVQVVQTEESDEKAWM